MIVYPHRKRKLLLPYNAETFLARLRAYEDYEVTVENDTFRMTHVLIGGSGPAPLLTCMLHTDFKGEFHEQGDSTQVVLKPRLYSLLRVISALLVAAVALIVLFFSFLELPKNGFVDGFLPGLVGAALFYGIIYFVHWLRVLHQVHEFKDHFMKDTPKAE